METEAQLPLSRERAVAVLAQWRRFQAGLAVDEALVRPVILRSWQRCRRAGFPADTLALCPIGKTIVDARVADAAEQAAAWRQASGQFRR